jgi:hypothetical protein
MLSALNFRTVATLLFSAVAVLFATGVAAQDVPQKDVFCNNRVVNADLGASAECVSTCGAPRALFPFPADDPACFNGLVCCYDPLNVASDTCAQAAADNEMTQGACTLAAQCLPPTFQPINDAPYPEPLCPTGQVCCGRMGGEAVATPDSAGGPQPGRAVSRSRSFLEM